jgi:hypothetical protein
MVENMPAHARSVVETRKAIDFGYGKIRTMGADHTGAGSATPMGTTFNL